MILADPRGPLRHLTADPDYAEASSGPGPLTGRFGMTADDRGGSYFNFADRLARSVHPGIGSFCTCQASLGICVHEPTAISRPPAISGSSRL
jgi:hypothetical protein